MAKSLEIFQVLEILYLQWIKYLQYAQKSATGDTGGIGDISQSSGAANTTASTEQKQPDQTFGFQCYYCDSFKTNSNDGYECHVIMKHGQGHPCYPSKADLKKLGLKAQGKSWET